MTHRHKTADHGLGQTTIATTVLAALWLDAVKAQRVLDRHLCAHVGLCRCAA